LFLLSCVAAPTRTSILLLWAGSASYGVCASNVWAITQTLAGPSAAGEWTGLQNFIGNLAGGAAPAVAGLALGRTGKFMTAFVITCAVASVGGCVWTVLVSPVRAL